MELRRYKDILALETAQGDVVGFHVRTLEMAELSPQAWAAMAEDTSLPSNAEALSEIATWEQESANQIPAKHEFKIKNVTINVTQICNLQCKYCAAGGDGTYGDPVRKISVEQTLPQIKFFIDKLNPGESFAINFLGGEPLLYPIGMEAIGLYARQLGQERGVTIQLSVTTNGTLFNEDTLATLKKIKCSVTISMDGGKEITDQERPSKDGKSTSDKILAGLPLLFQAKAELGRIRFHGVYGRFNMDVVKAYRFFSEFPVTEFEFTYDHIEVSEDVNQQFIQQMSLVAEMAYDKGGETELRRIRFFDNIFSRIDNRDPVRHYCGAGQSYLMIDAKNQLYTCPWDVNTPSEKVGQGLSLDHEKLAKYQGDLIEKNDCQACWAKNLCGGGCMYIHKNRTGNKNKVDSNFCMRTKHLLALALLYYQRSRAAA